MTLFPSAVVSAPSPAPAYQGRRSGLPARLLAAGLAAGLLGGCLPDWKRDITGSILPFKRSAAQPEPTEADWRELAEQAGKRYEANPGDKMAALAYGRSLREIGQHQQAAAVLRQATMRAPEDKDLLAAYGRSLIDVGNLREASAVLARAHTQDKPDWRVLSAQGTVADQQGNHEEARRFYEAGLRLAPDEPSLLSNLGLSYALSRDLPAAERALRQAAASPRADQRVRQNLALVLGLMGQAAEAESLLKRDLPPAQAAAGAAYFKQLGGHAAPARAAAVSSAVARPERRAPVAATPAIPAAPAAVPLQTPVPVRTADPEPVVAPVVAAPVAAPLAASAPPATRPPSRRKREMLPPPAGGQTRPPLLPAAEPDLDELPVDGIALRPAVE